MGALWMVSVAEVAARTKLPRPLHIMFLSLPLSRKPRFVGSGTLCVVRRGSCGASSPANDSIETTEVFPRSHNITAGLAQCANTPERLSTSSNVVREKVCWTPASGLPRKSWATRRHWPARDTTLARRWRGGLDDARRRRRREVEDAESAPSCS